MSCVTADTNVFYYLGNGKLEKPVVAEPGQRLCANPLNVLEIAAGIGVNGWEDRRGAARAILDFADEMRRDPEEHLATLYGATVDEAEPELWRATCKAIADADNPAHLAAGVPDLHERVVRTVKAQIAADTKNTHYYDFLENMLTVCDDYVPGYRDACLNGTQAPTVPKTQRPKVCQILRSGAFRRFFFTQLARRVDLVTGKMPELQGDAQETAYTNVFPYIAAYTTYVELLITTGQKPQANDFGDLELFFFAQPGDFVATAEKRWIRIADKAGVGDYVKALAPT
jgi:hypothetical protein